MDDLAKLKHLIGHWAEHNTEHAETYREWSGRADRMGNAELADVLGKIAEETAGLAHLFEKAFRLCG